MKCGSPRRLVLYALLLLVPVGGIEAASILHTLDAQLYRDEATLYSSVGMVSGSGLGGSGVLISDRWVLTAGHISDFKGPGSTFQVGGATYNVAQAISYPGRTTFSTNNDVGLLRLTTSVVNVQPTTMYRFESKASLLGREATWVGIGISGTGLNPQNGGLEKRAFTNVIDGFTPYAGLTGPSFYSDFDHPDGTSNSLASIGSGSSATRLEGNVTPGDSGGGVFVTVDGVRYLVGINSYLASFTPPGGNGKYGDLSGATSLHDFHQWIFDTTGVYPVPEPGPVLLLGLGGLLALRRRR